MNTAKIAKFDLDLFSDEILTNPYPTYKELRDAGPVVWIERQQAYACARYNETRGVLSDNATFISSKGVGFNDFLNRAFQGTIIQSDMPDHTALREALGEKMSVQGLAYLKDHAQRKANDLVLEMKTRSSFDGVADFARVFPLMIVGELIGLPEDGRERLIAWGDANFNVIGPENKRYEDSLPIFDQCFAYISWLHEDPKGRLREGGLGRSLYDAADRGVIRNDQCPALMAAYLVAGIDTTIASIANMLDLFGRNQSQWEKLKANPQLAPRAFNEVLRIASPALCFKRVAAHDTELSGVTIEMDADVIVLYASANRDERKYADPDMFDITRNAGDHLAFGYGLHNCAGRALARLEANAIMTALAENVDYIEVGTASQHLNNTVRSLAKLDVKFA